MRQPQLGRLAVCLVRAIGFVFIFIISGAVSLAETPSRLINMEPIALVVAEPVRTTELRATTTGFGEVQAQPAKVVSIDAPLAGTVDKVYVRAGQIVRQGSPVAELSASPATEQAFRDAQTAVEFARSKLDRTRLLWKQGATTKDVLDQAEIAFRKAEASLEALKRVGAQSSQLTLAAPIDGTVTAVSVAEGDRVPQNAKVLSMTPADALAVLLGIEPEDIGQVHIGMSVSLSPAVNANDHYFGKVAATNEVIDPKTRLVDVMVEIENPDGHPPLIGTEMRGEIELRRDRTLVVPRSAVLYGQKGPYVYVVQNGRAHRVAVTLGLESDKMIGLSGSIKAGDLVIVQGNYELQDGMKVEQVAHAVP